MHVLLKVSLVLHDELYTGAPRIRIEGKASWSGMRGSWAAHLDHCWLESVAPGVGRNVVEDVLQASEAARALAMQRVQRDVEEFCSHIVVPLILRSVVRVA